MTTRRFVLSSLWGTVALSALSGCESIRHFFQPEVSRTAIDIHAHFFNGRDVPVIGFLKQTLIRDPHAPVDPDMGSDAFLGLLKYILLANTPTAQEELDGLGGRVSPMSVEAILKRDQKNVEAGLASFTREANQRTIELSTTRSSEDQLLDRIALEAGVPGLRTGLQTPENQANSLAQSIYQQGGNAGLRTGEERQYVHRTPLMQTLRWAGILTRSRLDILAELERLYGGPDLIRIFSPSLVDFSAWLVTRETVTPLEDQLEVVAAIAQRTDTSLILPFLPFCPLRAALEVEDDPQIDTLRHVKRGILELGFVGVKLYPPMGFRPVGNTDDLTWVPRKPQGGGPALDAALETLFLWCITNEVPIKAHANNSVAAGPNTGTFADPAGWQALMRDARFRELSVNLAHFGGFDETEDNSAFTSQGDWEETLASMVNEFPNVYFDLGFWSEVADQDSSNRARILERAAVLIDRSPKMLKRMMYGSDWSMIGRLPNHPAYLADIQNALTELGLDTIETEAVMGGNAARYLGLHRNGQQRQRVQQAYGENPIYRDIFES